MYSETHKMYEYENIMLSKRSIKRSTNESILRASIYLEF